jgi:hypothetical protein
MTLEPMWIIQGLLYILLGVLAWNFKKVEGKCESTAKEFADYKTYVVQTFVTDSHLTKSMDTLNQNIKTVLETVNKIENRLYVKEQKQN